MSATAGKKNGTIEFWRFICAFGIVCCHAVTVSEDAHLLRAGAICVEFFFVVSGYLMAHSISRMPPLQEGRLGTETLQFIKKKIVALCPNYYVAWVIAFFCHLLANGIFSFRGIAATFGKCIWELSFITMSGLAYMRANGAVWYISSMLLAMLIVFPLLRRYFELFLRVIAPAAALFLLGYLLRECGHLRVPTEWMGFTYKGNLRALAEICMGISIYPMSQWLRSIKLTRVSRIIAAILEHGGYFVLLYGASLPKGTKYDFLILCFVASSIMITFSGQSGLAWVYDHPLCFWLGEFSLSLYLGHWFYAKWLSTLLPDWSGSDLLKVYLLLAFTTALFIMYFSKALRKIFPVLKRKLLPFFIRESEPGSN